MNGTKILIFPRLFLNFMYFMFFNIFNLSYVHSTNIFCPAQFCSPSTQNCPFSVVWAHLRLLGVPSSLGKTLFYATGLLMEIRRCLFTSLL